MPALLQTFLTAVAALGAVVGTILLAGRAAKHARLNRPGTGRGRVLREALVLDRTRRLHVVACDGRDLLLLTGGVTDQVVAWLPPAPSPAP